MKAMVLEKTHDLSRIRNPLKLAQVAVPEPADDQLLIKVAACGVCHTELDEIEGRTPPPSFPVIPGHQVVGIVAATGSNSAPYKKGDRVGISWFYSSCGKCGYCKEGLENLCADFSATGRDFNGGYAEYMVVPAESAFGIPEVFSHTEAAPLLCAGAIGYRSLRLSGLKNGGLLGLTGFGASGHLIIKMAEKKFPESDVYVFARSPEERAFAEELGAVWTGETEAVSPEKLDCIIDTTPVWKPPVEAMKNLKKAGRLVINAIRKEDFDKDYLLNIDYARDMWCEKEIKTVANVAKNDVAQFLELAADIPIKPAAETYVLEDANRALIELKEGKIRGAKVLRFS
jgi:propanol-preferring alcohol dehydrogenase